MGRRYPRTPHLPWSPGASADDVRLAAHGFEGQEVVVTEKLDGENTTLTRDGLHARSPDGAHHPSRTRLKALHAQICPSLPPGVRVCGENLSARHSLAYDTLLGWFSCFSVWEGERALSWDDTVVFAHARGLPTPRVLYRGPWDETVVRGLKIDRKQEEGYVVRTAAGFEHAAFGQHVAKWVRRDHVTTDTHWMLAPVVWNSLSADAVPWSLASGGPVDLDALRVWCGGSGEPLDLGGLGEARVEGLVASQLLHGVDLPVLCGRIGLERAVRVEALVRLHPRLRLAVDDDTRAGGLTSLARATDLCVLHALAAHVQPDEQIGWSRLHAEEAGLWRRDALADWTGRLAAQLPEGAQVDRLLGDALWARSEGKLRSPEEAVAWLHPERKRIAPTLHVLVGPSGSGKSTLAKTLSGTVIELDKRRTHFDRKEEARILHAAAADLQTVLETGDAVWDATGLTPAQRAVPLQIARSLRCRTVLHGLLTPRSVADARNRRRRKPVPDAVLDRQWARVRWPLPHEAHQVEWHAPSQLE